MRLRSILICHLALALGTAALNMPALSQELTPEAYTGEESVTEYLTKTLPKNLYLGARGTFTGWNIMMLGGGTGAALLLSQTDADQDVQRELSGSLGDFSIIGDVGGSAITLGGLSIVSFIFAESGDNRKLLETSKALIESQIITLTMTGALKLAVGRERPDGSGSRLSSSFPSGHVSGSFAFATVIDQMYGHKAGVPLYLAAGFVGLSRLSDDKHFLSDVLFGAVLGTVVGRSVARLHKQDDNGHRLSIMPFVYDRTAGLAMSFMW